MNHLRSFLILWLSGTGLVFAIMLVQTLGGVYGGDLIMAWLWFAACLLPVTLLLINRRRKKEAVRGNVTIYKLIMGLSILYVIAVLLVIFLRPIVDMHNPVGLMKRASIGLIPFQLLLFILIRNFIILEKNASANVQEFVKKVNTRYQKLSGEQHSVFISYSESDSYWLERIKTHLQPLLRRGELDIWAHNDMLAGTERKAALEAALKKADIAIVLISADFMSDDNTYGELTELLKKAKAEEATVIIPVFANHVFVPEGSGILQFEPLNPMNQPLAGLPNSEQEAFMAKLSGLVNEMV